MDIRVLALGFAALFTSIIVIILFKRRDKKSFEDWFKEVEGIFIKRGYSPYYVECLSKRAWIDRWADGLTPQEAFAEYFEEESANGFISSRKGS